VFSEVTKIAQSAGHPHRTAWMFKLVVRQQVNCQDTKHTASTKEHSDQCFAFEH